MIRSACRGEKKSDVSIPVPMYYSYLCKVNLRHIYESPLRITLGIVEGFFLFNLFSVYDTISYCKHESSLTCRSPQCVLTRNSGNQNYDLYIRSCARALVCVCVCVQFTYINHVPPRRHGHGVLYAFYNIIIIVDPSEQPFC